MKVRVHYNLHKKVWSVLAKDGPIAHYADLMLGDVSMVVQQGGRRRVLRTKQKCVHAFVKGDWVGPADPVLIDETWERVSYNPYLAGHFVSKADGREVSGASRAMFLAGGVLWVSGV